MLIISLVLLCLNIVLMIILYRKVSHNFSQNAYRDRIRAEVNRLIIDIEHQSDHAVTVLENKMQQIEKLLANTDRHLALIEQEYEKWTYQQRFIQNQQTAKKEPVAVYTKPRGSSDVSSVSAPLLNPREQVIELARQGFSIDFIAEKVDLPLGEIALILSIDG